MSDLKEDKTSRKLIYKILGIILIIVFCIYCVIYKDKLLIIKTVNSQKLVVISLLIILHRVFAALRFRVLCKPYGADVSFADAFFISMVSNAVNLISPLRPGIVARAYFLKDKYNFHYSYFPSLLLGSAILSLFSGGIVLLCAFIIDFINGKINTWQIGVIPVMLCITTIIFWIKPKNICVRIPGKLGEKLNRAFEGWLLLRSNVRTMVIVCWYHLLLFVISGSLIALSFHAIGVYISLLTAVFISVFNFYVTLINLTPANIGMQEWATAYMAQFAGVNFHSGVAATLIIHSIGIIINLVGGAIGYFVLLGKKRTH